MNRLRRWWSHRPLRMRITLAVGGVALVALLALGRLGAGLALDVLLDGFDADLTARATAGAERLGGSATADRVGPSLRVVDRAGDPVDGGPPLPVREDAMRSLSAGEPATTLGPVGPVRWAAAPVVTADGSTWFVLASADLFAGGPVVAARAVLGFLLAAVAVALLVTLTAWLAGRAALVPVDRMRRAAAELAPGERLPVPPARDELQALAGEINALLARRDEAASRLERFTGDAAHELRSPVASLRAQAEVAVAHPDPAMAEDTLRSVAHEARRLSVLLDGLMALARADAGRRPEARPVDVVAAARSAVERARTPDGPAIELITPGPAVVAAGAAEVDLVLDNLLENGTRHARGLVRIAVLPAGRWVRLVVDDDGPGIPGPDRARVFDRFTRLEPESGRGSGLGLALVDAAVRGRGGTVAAAAAPTGGARLEVRWPATAPSP
ncbi:sensor histidine kinase [Pseudonocardia endophytica]|uniref:histidine kinase n=1 Tax=Pseudonocardia endophytica TaxID=401976 RepID=A0A4R1HPA6_PSEEN|nr:HAMP domain-containing sensor histidine kinase [Pseudonocardia endophytica]TCK24377.1 signal transduction histidine kinase [Pseudonocardia endophytica]